jgi:pyridinium-3,5-biscarboxylic acid mononucleotide sulfurtransferase
LGVRHEVIPTHEVEREVYARNDDRRCFHCKAELYATLRTVLLQPGSPDAVVLSGANADDAAEFRPGLEAGFRQSIRSPLLEEGMRKEAVRAVARFLGLSVADKPPLACLSSRVVFGIRISPELLARIDRAEQAVRDLGFDLVRVRHRGDHASIEVEPFEVSRLKGHPRLADVLAILRRLGWPTVMIDPRGYRPGSLTPPAAPDRTSAN